MIFHRIVLLGDVAESSQWVGLAKKLVRQSEKLGVSNRTWWVSTNTSIHVQYVGKEFGKITITSEPGGGYQFFGAEEILYKTGVDPENSDRYLPNGNWVLVKESGNQLKAKALVSSLHPTPNDGGWYYSENPYTDAEFQKHLWFPFAHQPDGCGVRTWIDSHQAQKQSLVYCWAETTPVYNAFRKSGAGYTHENPYCLSDIGYDIAPTVCQGRKATVQVPDTDWYRTSGIYTVNDALWGSRTFIICVDVSGTFYCYPLGVAGANLIGLEDPANKANVESKYVQSQAAPYPDWVDIPDIGRNSSLPTSEQLLERCPTWVFSPQGDKAVAICYHRDEPWSDELYSSSLYEFNGTKRQDLKEDWPGLVEVTFSVSLNGSNAENFSFTVVLAKNQFSKEDGRGYIAAGYSGIDSEELGVSYNDLLVLEHRYFYKNLFALASDYDSPENGYTVETEDAYVTRPPYLVAKAVVTKGETDVLSWLSVCTGFSGRWDADFNTFPFFDFTTLTDAPSNCASKEIIYTTEIYSIDFSTLSFLLGTSLTVSGGKSGGFRFFPEKDYVIQWPRRYYASAFLVNAISLGKVDESKCIGHPELKPVISDYFNLTNEALTDFIEGMTPVNLLASIDYTVWEVPHDGENRLHGPWGDLYNLYYYKYWVFHNSSFDELTVRQFANALVHDGFGSTTTHKLLFALTMVDFLYSERYRLLDFNVYQNPTGYSELFPDRWLLMQPTVFTYFDSEYAVRPGMIWMKITTPAQGNTEFISDLVVHGEPSSAFTGYPMGILLHSKLTFAVSYGLWNPNHKLSTYPDGSYAVFAGPFAASTSVQESHPNTTDYVAELNQDYVDSLEQMVFDIIKFRKQKLVNQEIVTTELKTTHLEAMNQAFKKISLALTPEQYYFQFSLENGQLKINSRIGSPSLPTEPINLHSSCFFGEYDDQLFDQWYGLSKRLTPIDQCGMRLSYVYQADNRLFLKLYSMFSDFRELDDAKYPYVTSTPRLEGVFMGRPVPVKKT